MKTSLSSLSHAWMAPFLSLCACGCNPSGPTSPAPPLPVASPITNPATGAEGSLPPAVNPDEARRIEEYDLSLESLKKDLEKKGEVYRKHVGGGAGGGSADVLIKTRIRTRLQDDPLVPAMSLDLEVDRGRVILTGRVGRLEELQRALLAALYVEDVTEVLSRLAVEPDDGSGSTKGEGPAHPLPSK